MVSSDKLLNIEDLSISYETKGGDLTAVSDASLSLEEGEYIGLVGESGCGKSTLAKAILGGLDRNGSVTAGSIEYKGRELQNMSERELNETIRWKEISWIPQSSMNVLDPIKPVKKIALDIARTHTELSDDEALQQFMDILEIVGIQRSRISDSPYEFSGGMRQRVIIALSLFLEPSIVIADEPTTALDVIMQDQVFKYLNEIKDESEISMILITHDISLVFESCDKMAVMHSGQVAETGSVEEIYHEPRHPYTILLQNSFPDIRYPKRELETIDGHPPQTFGKVDYCTFVERCPWAVPECEEEAPKLERVENQGSEDPTHAAACVRKEEAHDLYEQEQVGTTDG